MRQKPWKPALLATLMALGLAGCGNGDEPAPAAEAPTGEASPAPADEALEGELSPEEQAGLVDDDEAAPETVDEAPDEVSEEVPEDIPEAETLGESPASTLDEGAALPGETTADDIDAIIEETERRFEEAQRRIDEQFEVAEEEAAAPEPVMEGDDAFDTGMDFDTGLDDDQLDTGGPTSSDVDAIIEEQERRFEEAQRRLDEQFDEVGQEMPEFEPMESEPLELEPMESDNP